MEFKAITHKLIARICAYCRENGLAAPGQVRTTKLVYLVEYNYYGWEQKRFPNLDWIFWHYGPWSKTLSSVLTKDFHAPLEKEIEPGKFRPVYWTPPQFDRPRLKFDKVAIEGTILRVLDRFAAMPYNELLDYVYFETEPMRGVAQGQKLDFSVIPKTQPFVDPVSLLSPKIFHRLRKKIDKLEIPEIGAVDLAKLADSAILDSTTNVEKGGSFTLPTGPVRITNKGKTDLRRSFDD